MTDLSRAVQHCWKPRSLAAAFFSGHVLGVLLVLRASSRPPRGRSVVRSAVRGEDDGVSGGGQSVGRRTELQGGGCRPRGRPSCGRPSRGCQTCGCPSRGVHSAACHCGGSVDGIDTIQMVSIPSRWHRINTISMVSVPYHRGGINTISMASKSSRWYRYDAISMASIP